MKSSVRVDCHAFPEDPSPLLSSPVGGVIWLQFRGACGVGWGSARWGGVYVSGGLEIVSASGRCCKTTSYALPRRAPPKTTRSRQRTPSFMHFGQFLMDALHEGLLVRVCPCGRCMQIIAGGGFGCQAPALPERAGIVCRRVVSKGRGQTRGPQGPVFADSGPVPGRALSLQMLCPLPGRSPSNAVVILKRPPSHRR